MTPQFASVLYLDLDHTLFEGPWEPAVFEEICEELGRKSGRKPKEIRRLLDRENKAREKEYRLKSATWAMDWDDIAQTVASNPGSHAGS
jgi:hypothetical protein